MKKTVFMTPGKSLVVKRTVSGKFYCKYGRDKWVRTTLTEIRKNLKNKNFTFNIENKSIFPSTEFIYYNEEDALKYQYRFDY